MNLKPLVERMKESFENGEDFNIKADDMADLENAITALESCKYYAKNIISLGYTECEDALAIIDEVNSALSDELC